MMAEMNNGALVIDDISQFETERLIEIYRPDIVCGGHQGKVRHPKERRAHEATPQLRLRRTLCRL